MAVQFYALNCLFLFKFFSRGSLINARKSRSSGCCIPPWWNAAACKANVQVGQLRTQTVYIPFSSIYIQASYIPSSSFFSYQVDLVIIQRVGKNGSHTEVIHRLQGLARTNERNNMLSFNLRVWHILPRAPLFVIFM